jgi:hypothetical protein
VSVARRRAEPAAAAATELLAETAASPVAETAASAQGQEWHGGRLMIRQEPNAPGQVRVIGSLTGDTVPVLLEAVSSGVCALDLSEVKRQARGCAATSVRFRDGNREVRRVIARRRPPGRGLRGGPRSARNLLKAGA